MREIIVASKGPFNQDLTEGLYVGMTPGCQSDVSNSNNETFSCFLRQSFSFRISIDFTFNLSLFKIQLKYRQKIQMFFNVVAEKVFVEDQLCYRLHISDCASPRFAWEWPR